MPHDIYPNLVVLHVNNLTIIKTNKCRHNIITKQICSTKEPLISHLGFLGNCARNSDLKHPRQGPPTIVHLDGRPQGCFYSKINLSGIISYSTTSNDHQLHSI